MIDATPQMTVIDVALCNAAMRALEAVETIEVPIAPDEVLRAQRLTARAGAAFNAVSVALSDAEVSR
jgi:hypothetical protein